MNSWTLESAPVELLHRRGGCGGRHGNGESLSAALTAAPHLATASALFSGSTPSAFGPLRHAERPSRRA